jgi:hypothetical protein
VRHDRNLPAPVAVAVAAVVVVASAVGPGQSKARVAVRSDWQAQPTSYDAYEPERGIHPHHRAKRSADYQRSRIRLRHKGDGK